MAVDIDLGNPNSACIVELASLQPDSHDMTQIDEVSSSCEPQEIISHEEAREALQGHCDKETTVSLRGNYLTFDDDPEIELIVLPNSKPVRAPPLGRMSALSDISEQSEHQDDYLTEGGISLNETGLIRPISTRRLTEQDSNSDSSDTDESSNGYHSRPKITRQPK